VPEPRAAAPGRHVRIPNLTKDRQGTLRLMSWWDHERVTSARVMVVGAGALGNEVLKNLALMGIGAIFLIDRDRIEAANLSRSVLFRTRDEGRLKTEAAAQAVRDIHPEVRLRTFDGDVVYDLGLGVFRRMDVVIGCLDNREARLAVNRACWKVGKPWVDGAIQELFGVARVFVPGEGACYECTLSEQDWVQLGQAHPCKGIAVANVLLGKVPTTPTISSIIAGFQAQEALKLLHGMKDFVLSGRGLIIHGLTNEIYTTRFLPKEDCDSHYRFGEVTELADAKAASFTGRDLFARIGSDLGTPCAVELDRELIVELECFACGTRDAVARPRARLTEAEGRCPKCAELREPATTHTWRGDEAYLDRPLADIGVPLGHVLAARGPKGRGFYELTGDLPDLLGEVLG